MCHALVIDGSMVIGRVIGGLLASLGCGSFDDAYTEEQAVAAAASRFPSRVVVGDLMETSSTLTVARRISARSGAPVLMITAEPDRMRQRLAADAPFDGLILLNDIQAAVALARAVNSETFSASSQIRWHS